MITGKKVKIEPLSLNDNDFMLTMLNDLEIAKFEGKNEFFINEIQQNNWFNNNNISKNTIACVIKTVDDNEKVGYISFHYVNEVSRVGHLAIKFSQNAQGKGLGVDTVKTMMSFLFFRMNMHRLQGHIVEFNHASKKLFIDKCGWKVEGTARKSIFMNGRYYDNTLVGILRDDFINEETDEFYLKYNEELK